MKCSHSRTQLGRRASRAAADHILSWRECVLCVPERMVYGRLEIDQDAVLRASLLEQAIGWYASYYW